MALNLPKLELNKKQLPLIVGGIVVLAAVGWFGWDYFAEEPAPPPPPAIPMTKPAAPKAQPVDSAKTRDKLIEDVVATTGLKQQLVQLPKRLVAGIAQAGKQQKKASAATIQAIESAMARSFTAEGFENRVNETLKKNFDQKHMQALANEFSTPAAKAMVGQERAEQTPAELAHFAVSPAATKPERAALVTRIDAATRASDFAVETAFVSMKELAEGLAGEGTPKAAALDKSIEKQREAETRRIRDATQLSLSYSYKDASDADLEKYAALYESADAKWYYGLVYDALLAEIKDASAAAGEHLAEMKPTAGAAKVVHAKAGGDARSCLKFATDAKIAKCAEAYR